MTEIEEKTGLIKRFLERNAQIDEIIRELRDNAQIDELENELADMGVLSGDIRAKLENLKI